jgi:DNA-binding ferritin-like protein
MSIKGKAAAKLAAKTGGKAVPGIGQAIMVVEGAPVALEEGTRAYQIFMEEKKKADKLAREGKPFRSIKAYYEAQAKSQSAAVKGIGRTAVTALVARQAADSMLPVKARKNSSLWKLQWQVNQDRQHVASLPEVNLRFVLTAGNRAYSVMVFDKAKGPAQLREAWQGLSHLRDAKLSVEDWLTENYPLHALASLAPSGRARKNGSLIWQDLPRLLGPRALAEVPELNLVFIVRGDGYGVVARRDKNGNLVQIEQLPHRERIGELKAEAEQWLEDNHPLFVLGQVAKENPTLGLKWVPRPGEINFTKGGSAEIPELGLLVVVGQAYPDGFRAKIWQREANWRLSARPLVTLGRSATWARLQKHVEAWISENYPLWVLGQLAKENPTRGIKWVTRPVQSSLSVRAYADIPELELSAIATKAQPDGFRVNIWQRTANGGLSVHPLVQLGPSPTLACLQKQAEDWIVKNYPLWALGQLAKKNSPKQDPDVVLSSRYPLAPASVQLWFNPEWTAPYSSNYANVYVLPNGLYARWDEDAGPPARPVGPQFVVFGPGPTDDIAYIDPHKPGFTLRLQKAGQMTLSNPRSQHSVHQARKARKSRAKWKRKIERTEKTPSWFVSQSAPYEEKARRGGKRPSKPKSKRPWQARRNPMMNEVELYQDILAHLRALQWVSWTSHWTASGPSYYGDHQLLQRLYEGKGGGPNINEEIDGLGERMVAYFGPPSVNPEAIVGRVHQLTGQAVQSSADQFEALLTMEMQLQHAIQRAWKANQASGEHMSLGIDDMLMGLANEREAAIYLLQRRLGGRKPLAGSVGRASVAPPAIPESLRTVTPRVDLDESFTPQPLDRSFRAFSKALPRPRLQAPELAAANPALPPGFSLQRGEHRGRPVFRIFRMGMDTGKYALRGERAAELAYKMAHRA